MSARPTLVRVRSDQKSWDAELEHNQNVLETAIPVPECANAGALPTAAMYRGCLATVGDGTAGAPHPLWSDGAAWHELGVPEVASFGALPSAATYRGRLVSVGTGGGTTGLFLSDGTTWHPVGLPLGVRQKVLSVIKTASFTIDPTAADWFLCDATAGAIAATLPSAATFKDYDFLVVKTDASGNAVTVTGTLSGVSNPALSAQFNKRRCYSSGSVWIRGD